MLPLIGNFKKTQKHMSIHAQLSPDAQAKLNAQRRNSTITSIIISLLLLALLGLALWAISIAIASKDTEEIVSYNAGAEPVEEVTKPEMTTEVKQEPSAPSSNLTKVITSQAPSPTSIPNTEVVVDEPALDFGNGDDFGDGWGSGGSGDGGGGGGASFFQQTIKAERIVYVIDYSASMGGTKIKLLKDELAKSVGGLNDRVDYQLIFFAGPAWVAGDEVNMAGNHKTAEVIHEKKTYKWKNEGRNVWEQTGKKQKVVWRKGTKSNIEESVKAVQETELVWGTTWDDPLEMALAMRPAPDYVFFMTDGAPGGGDPMGTAKRIGAKAKAKKIKINTIALMQPEAREAMKYLSEKTGGEFSMVNKDGSITK